MKRNTHEQEITPADIRKAEGAEKFLHARDEFYRFTPAPTREQLQSWRRIDTNWNK